MEYDRQLAKRLAWEASDDIKQRAFALATKHVGAQFGPDYVQMRIFIGALLLGLPLFALGPLGLVGLIIGGTVGGVWAQSSKSRHDAEWEETYRYYLVQCHENQIENSSGQVVFAD